MEITIIEQFGLLIKAIKSLISAIGWSTFFICFAILITAPHKEIIAKIKKYNDTDIK